MTETFSIKRGAEIRCAKTQGQLGWAAIGKNDGAIG